MHGSEIVGRSPDELAAAAALIAESVPCGEWLHVISYTHGLCGYVSMFRKQARGQAHPIRDARPMSTTQRDKLVCGASPQTKK
jgi:hypothetical protein